MQFNMTMNTTITASSEEEARSKLHDMVWRHYGVRCTSELDARLNLKIERICPACPDSRQIINQAWKNICSQGVVDAAQES